MFGSRSLKNYQEWTMEFKGINLPEKIILVTEITLKCKITENLMIHPVTKITEYIIEIMGFHSTCQRFEIIVINNCY